MDETAANPLIRVLAALDQLEPARPSQEASSLQEAREALLAAMEEREAFLVLVGKTAGLIDVLDDYQDALEHGDETRIAEMALASSEAEDEVIDALDQIYEILNPDAELSDDEDLLEALKLVADNSNEKPQR